ncbi:glyoxalase/bleomycin resistance/extradiol dioxygenase family protein [Sedimentibacter sp.]|uniref:VOC family protein n=1 Tax=Sedimentibacter sp. TaxID=1960295 RepID=UPI00289E3E5C|nr:glyoxalase/bleomycin resistance/extradiol dioxygenase family protein [Sedimentibacter sp.]
MVTPYLVFSGNCKEVLEFYQKVFGSEAGRSMPYGEYVPDGVKMTPTDLSTWVLHAEMKICGTNLWFADEIRSLAKGDIVRLTATVPIRQEADEIFNKLKDNGEITLPPTETFYSTFHASLIDKFGVHWNIVAEETPNQK